MIYWIIYLCAHICIRIGERSESWEARSQLNDLPHGHGFSFMKCGWGWDIKEACHQKHYLRWACRSGGVVRGDSDRKELGWLIHALRESFSREAGGGRHLVLEEASSCNPKSGST